MAGSSTRRRRTRNRFCPPPSPPCKGLSGRSLVHRSWLSLIIEWLPAMVRKCRLTSASKHKRKQRPKALRSEGWLVEPGRKSPSSSSQSTTCNTLILFIYFFSYDHNHRNFGRWSGVRSSRYAPLRFQRAIDAHTTDTHFTGNLRRTNTIALHIHNT